MSTIETTEIETKTLESIKADLGKALKEISRLRKLLKKKKVGSRE